MLDIQILVSVTLVYNHLYHCYLDVQPRGDGFNISRDAASSTGLAIRNPARTGSKVMKVDAERLEGQLGYSYSHRYF